MTDTIPVLRQHLSQREAELASLQARLKTAKEAAKQSSSAPVTPSISDIQKRYLSAVADLDSKRSSAQPIVTTPSDAVSSLANRWNKGIDGKKITRSSVTERGDVTTAKKNFSNLDVPKAVASPTANSTAPPKKKREENQPAELLVEDDDGLPSWAKNQRKLVIRKENARSSIRDVDVRELQGSVLEQASRDGSEVKGEKLEAKGNVKAALAMWGKTAEDDAKLIAQKKEEEEKKKLENARLQQEREEQQRKQAIQLAVEKFANMSLTQLGKEPDSDVELTAFLERKIHLVEKEIHKVEIEIESLQS